jgi:hypothetical protein
VNKLNFRIVSLKFALFTVDRKSAVIRAVSVPLLSNSNWQVALQSHKRLERKVSTSTPPLPMENVFQDSQWVPETTHLPNPVFTMVFFCINIYTHANVSPSLSEGAIYSFSLVYPSCQNLYSCMLRPLLSETNIT